VGTQWGDNKKKLIVTVGLTGSGKSTWAQKSGYPVVGRDAFGHALNAFNCFDAFSKKNYQKLFIILKIAIYALFDSGHDTVVLDWTNVTKKDREYWLHDSWETEYKIIPTDVETCLSRNNRPNTKEDIQRLLDTCDIPGIRGE